MVSLDVPYDANLGPVFETIRDAAAAACRDNPDVIAETQIEGITRFGEKALTVRTVTRVRPGRHDAVATALRLALKNAFDRLAGDGPRTGLVVAEQRPPRG